MDIHAQNNGIHTHKSEPNCYFRVDFTIILEWIQFQSEVIPNITPKRVDFHSA